MSLADSIPQICESCQHLRVGLGLWSDSHPTSISMSVTLTARCMKERNPDNGLCPEYTEREGELEIE